MLSTLTFGAPERLLLLLAVAALLVGALARVVRARRDRLAFADAALHASVLPARPGWRRALPAAVVVLGLGAATVGFARPQVLAESARERAVVLVTLDTSTSMLADDVAPDRLTAAVDAAQDFVRGLPEQVDVGLVTYNANVRLAVPPTPEHETVAAALEDLSLSGGTALGDAVLTGLSSLPAEVRSGPEPGEPPAARVVVLSDGGSTTGRPVSDAAAQARAYGVPVSTIAYGTDAGVVVQDGVTYPVPVDEAVLTELAEATGGQAYVAADAGQLADVYDDLGTRLAQETARRELTAPVTGLALGLLVLGALGSLWWGGRLV